MSRVLDGRTDSEPEERAGQDKRQKKLYVEPQLTREEVLPDIIGTPNAMMCISPPLLVENATFLA